MIHELMGRGEPSCRESQLEGFAAMGGVGLMGPGGAGLNAPEAGFGSGLGVGSCGTGSGVGVGGVGMGVVAMPGL